MSLVALLRDESQAGTMMIALTKIGPNRVAITNHLERTRSTYSRLMIAQSLAMSRHSLLDPPAHAPAPGARAPAPTFCRKISWSEGWIISNRWTDAPDSTM